MEQKAAKKKKRKKENKEWQSSLVVVAKQAYSIEMQIYSICSPIHSNIRNLRTLSAVGSGSVGADDVDNDGDVGGGGCTAFKRNDLFQSRKNVFTSNCAVSNNDPNHSHKYTGQNAHFSSYSHVKSHKQTDDERLNINDICRF